MIRLTESEQHSEQKRRERKAVDTREREKQDTLCLRDVRLSVYEGPTGAVPLSCWVRCGEWTDGEGGRECMNNKRVRVDFLVLPQLIKHLTYWI